MPPIISFIGWHNSGKTTLANRVVGLLKAKGYTVAVLKSTKETGIETESARTDTAIHWHAGADSVALVAPDQLIIRSRQPRLDPVTLAHRYFSEMDLVVAEGFKHTAGIAKIEVRRDASAPLLRDQVDNVIATATDLPCVQGRVFGLDQVEQLTDFILARLQPKRPPTTVYVHLRINGRSLPCPELVQRRLEAVLRELEGSCVLPPADTGIDLQISLTTKQEPAAMADAEETGNQQNTGGPHG